MALSTTLSHLNQFQAKVLNKVNIKMFKQKKSVLFSHILFEFYWMGEKFHKKNKQSVFLTDLIWTKYLYIEIKIYSFKRLFKNLFLEKYNLLIKNSS